MVRFPAGPQHAHLLVPTPSPPVLFARAVLSLVLVLGAMTVLWAVARTLCGEPLGLASGQWGWFWTFRGRLTLALFAFFLIPMAAFGETTYRALSREVERTAAALADRALEQTADEVQGATLGELAQHVGADLLLYHRGVLAEAAAPEVIDLGLYHAWLPTHVYLGFTVGEAVQQHEEAASKGTSTWSPTASWASRTCSPAPPRWPRARSRGASASSRTWCSSRSWPARRSPSSSRCWWGARSPARSRR